MSVGREGDPGCCEVGASYFHAERIVEGFAVALSLKCSVSEEIGVACCVSQSECKGKGKGSGTYVV